MITYASVCDGIGAVHQAWQPLGWKCKWTSEIAPFPAAVVDHHWSLPNLGDMNLITENQLEQHGPIDLLVGGTPCQSFSVAGLRGGLDDARGNLALRFMQIAGVLRPSYILWENVPGVLSSGERRDFGSILGALAELGYGWAYRILDARYFGVAQRRRRVFVVGCLGDWRRAAAVLFERDCLQGDTSPRRKTKSDVTGTIDGSTDRRRGAGINPAMLAVASTGEVSHCLNAGAMKRIDYESETLIAFTTEQTPKFSRDTALTLTKQSPTGGGQPQCVAQGMAVRRLTPEECEALQGFPRGYTAIHYRGKPAKDGPRYKALGNSMAVPCMAWIGRRIVEATQAESI